MKRSGSTFDDSMKVAVLTHWAQESARAIIVAMAARTDGYYQSMRPVEISGRSYNTFGISSSSDEGPVPIDAGEIGASKRMLGLRERSPSIPLLVEAECGQDEQQKGIGKDGKRKHGNGRVKSKGKESPVRFQGACNYSGKPRHMAKDSTVKAGGLVVISGEDFCVQFGKRISAVPQGKS